MAKNYQQSTQSQKIPFWRRRWFWGVVVGGIYILSIKQIANIEPIASFSVSNIIAFSKGFFYGLPTGIALVFTLIFRFPFYSTITSNTIIYNIFITIYYLILVCLLYKTFWKKKVSIRYPVIFLLIVIINMLGIWFINSFRGF
jgi:hypothetical protein